MLWSKCGSVVLFLSVCIRTTVKASTSTFSSHYYPADLDSASSYNEFLADLLKKRTIETLKNCNDVKDNDELNRCVYLPDKLMVRIVYAVSILYLNFIKKNTIKKKNMYFLKLCFMIAFLFYVTISIRIYMPFDIIWNEKLP